MKYYNKTNTEAMQATSIKLQFLRFFATIQDKDLYTLYTSIILSIDENSQQRRQA